MKKLSMDKLVNTVINERKQKDLLRFSLLKQQESTGQ